MPMSRGELILLAIFFFFNMGMSSLYTYRYPFRGKNVLMFLNNCFSQIYSSIQDSKTLSGIRNSQFLITKSLLIILFPSTNLFNSLRPATYDQASQKQASSL